ncbi:protein mono-ADP-ribosyltransferase PARP12-like [Antedon mediterranea]|uniref:protein mono-ADP-ribosyltransferase PARP12-like n=1 Tax=Antedon mediterranea TaxID=105859 RepID=UPI003AF6581C
MLASDGLDLILVERLEVKGDEDVSDAYLVSPWSWYWQDECGKWIEYSEQNTKQSARSDKESSDFESLFKAYKNENGSFSVKFKAGNQNYTLDFSAMSQTNDRYHTRKPVCRRPVRQIKPKDVEKYRKEKPWLHTHTFPRTWDTTIKTKTHRLVKVTKEANNEEYREISKLFKRTLPDGAITRLERVQNEICWEAFARQRETMMKKNSRRKVEELQLFHGTMQDKVDDICRDNFDFRLSGTRVGHVYGQGAYFAKSAKYSNDYAEKDSVGRKRMFVARILVGSYTVGTKEMHRPPFKDPADKSKGMYDSCVDDVANPSIFVVFDNHQVYPEYLIT